MKDPTSANKYDDSRNIEKVHFRDGDSKRNNCLSNQNGNSQDHKENFKLIDLSDEEIMPPTPDPPLKKEGF